MDENASTVEYEYVRMVTYPFPVRPGVVARITLPALVTKQQAARIGRCIATLVIGDPPPARRAVRAKVRKRIPLRHVTLRP